MVNHIERKRQLSLVIRSEYIRMDECLCWIARVKPLRRRDSGLRNIHADIIRVDREPQLRTVARAKLDDGLDSVVLDEPVQDLRLEHGQAVVRAGPRGTSFAIA